MRVRAHSRSRSLRRRLGAAALAARRHSLAIVVYTRRRPTRQRARGPHATTDERRRCRARLRAARSCLRFVMAALEFEICEMRFAVAVAAVGCGELTSTRAT